MNKHIRAKTIIFAGPSAVGKTFIANELINKYSDSFEQAKLYTTRKPRAGEPQSDRIFISLKEFKEMISAQKFVVYDEFGSNFYGFTKNSLIPKNKHLLVNAWPWLIPQFSELEHSVIIGMQAPENYEKLLVDRMKNRGDSEDTIIKRLELIKRDYTDLEKNKEIVRKNGMFFVVDNDNSIPDKIIPWIENKLLLKS